MRGSVRDAATGAEVIKTRSKRLAVVLTRLLNGEEVARPNIVDPSPLSRYAVTNGHRAGEWHILAALSTAQAPSAFGDGIVAQTSDEVLARRAAALLNQVDPEPRRHARRDIGWW
jgi:hypothetical protein